MFSCTSTKGNVSLLSLLKKIMRELQKFYICHASIENVWQALVQPKEIDGWGAGPAVMSEREGFSFSLWGGAIFGKNIIVISQKKIVQEWYGDTNWQTPSIVTFNFSTFENATHIDLFQVNIPDTEFLSINKGWDTYYIGPLVQYVENK